jgi:hypothetical protein
MTTPAGYAFNVAKNKNLWFWLAVVVIVIIVLYQLRKLISSAGSFVAVAANKPVGIDLDYFTNLLYNATARGTTSAQHETELRTILSLPDSDIAYIANYWKTVHPDETIVQRVNNANSLFGVLPNVFFDDTLASQLIQRFQRYE